MSIIDQTTPTTRHPNERTLPTPAWANVSELFIDVDRSVRLLHSWEAPQGGQVTCGGSEVLQFGVELHQDDIVSQAGCSIVYGHGDPFVFLTPLDARFTTTIEARAFAAAILACCDRLDAAN